MSPTCSLCQLETLEGYTYPFHLGKTVERTETPFVDYGQIKTKIHVKIHFEPDTHDVFICYTCLLKPALKWYTIGAFCGLLLIPTLVGTIPGIAGSIYLFKAAKLRRKAISGTDKAFQSQYLLKEKKALDAYGSRRALQIVKKEKSASGQKYDFFLTPDQFAAWKNDPSASWS